MPDGGCGCGVWVGGLRLWCGRGCWTRGSGGDGYTGVMRPACGQHEERIALLEAEIVVVRAERDELAATVEALRAKVVELTKHAFGDRSERAKKTPGGGSCVVRSITDTDSG